MSSTLTVISPSTPAVVEAQNRLDLQEHEDGSLAGHFKVGAETAAHLLPLLSPLTKPQPGDDRTLSERQGDALAEVIRLAADSGQAPIEGGERPHIAVTVSLKTLQTGIGKAPRRWPVVDSRAGPPPGLRCRNCPDRPG
jgi:hypothetical protein